MCQLTKGQYMAKASKAASPEQAPESEGVNLAARDSVKNGVNTPTQAVRNNETDEAPMPNRKKTDEA